MKELVFKKGIYKFDSPIKNGIYSNPNFHCVLLELDKNIENPIFYIFTFDGDLLFSYSFLDIFSLFENVFIDDDISIAGVDGLFSVLFITSRNNYFRISISEYFK